VPVPPPAAPCPLGRCGASIPARLLEDAEQNHPGGNPGANLKSISHRCPPDSGGILWELTTETIQLPLG